MSRPPPITTLTATLLPYPPRCRSVPARLPRSPPQLTRPLELCLHAGNRAPTRRGRGATAARRYRSTLADILASHQFPRELRLLRARRRRKRRPQTATPT